MNKPKPPHTVIFCEKEETIIRYVREGETVQEAIKRLAEWGTALTPMHVDVAIERVELAFNCTTPSTSYRRCELTIGPPHGECCRRVLESEAYSSSRMREMGMANRELRKSTHVVVW